MDSSPAPVMMQVEEEKSASTPSATSAAVPPALPHPPEYYLIPSATTHSTAPKHTPETIAALAALPDDSPGYVPVKKHHLVNPYGGAAAKEDTRISNRNNQKPVDATPTPSPTVDDVAELQTGRKAQKVTRDSTASGSAVNNSEDAAEDNCCVRNDMISSPPAVDTNNDVPMTDAAASTTLNGVKLEKKRKRGQNKPHEREINHQQTSVLKSGLCRSVALGIECKWGDKCKFQHDTTLLEAVKGADFPGPCPLFQRYGACQAGLACKYAKEGHDEKYRPSVIPNPSTPLAYERNLMPKEILGDYRSAGEGKNAEKRSEQLFPQTTALMVKYEAWKKKYDQLRDKKQAEKQQQQREQTRALKAAREAQLLANRAKADEMLKARAAGLTTSTATDATPPTPVVPASTESSAPTPMEVETTPTTAPTSAAETVPASASSSATAPASSTSAPTITASVLPPSFPVNTPEMDIEIAALKAMYKPSVPMKLDPFQIVSEDYVDWSSGLILIDIERKKFDFKDKLYLAPLTTVGNLPFRLVCRSFGCDVTIGEMALATSLSKGSGTEWALTRRHVSEKYFGIQIAGAFPNQIGRACEMINKYCEVDFVDLNIGCPIDPVTNQGMGSALMQRKRAKNIEPILRTMTSLLDCPATIKMRMGWSSSELTCMELLPIVHRCGMAAVTIHGRTRQQRYSKAADWKFVQEAANYAHEKLNGLPVIANGDVYTFEDYEALINPQSNITTTMIARGALVKPWLFTEIKERRHWDISASERFDMLKQFVHFGHEHFGTDTKGVENTRRYLLEWLSFLHRYVPVGLLERPLINHGIQMKTPSYYARSDLEQLLASPESKDWIRLSEMLIGPVPKDFVFVPKHKSSANDDGKQTVEG